VNGNGNGKKKRRNRIIYAVIGVVVVLCAVIGLIAATRGGTKIDPSKLAKVEKGDLAKSVVATGKVGLLDREARLTVLMVNDGHSRRPPERGEPVRLFWRAEHEVPVA